jgi:hypothetical protein
MAKKNVLISGEICRSGRRLKISRLPVLELRASFL